MRYDKPCLKKDWKHAFLMHDNYEHVVIDGVEMTSKNIWDYEGSREGLVDKIASYFFNEGFKLESLASPEDLGKELMKLAKADPNSALAGDGSIKNTSRVGLDICRLFCQKSFYATRVNGMPSILDVYKDKDLIKKVLRNRMGWYTTTETLVLDDGTALEGEHPYLFDISHKMLVQGCHSAMVSANVSNFRPLVAKLLMSKHCPKGGKVLDLSAGWGARLLAAASLGLSYYGIDPMTARELSSLADAIKKCKDAYDGSYEMKIAEDVSEDASAYASMPDGINYAIACPPYFKLEEYDCERNSTDVYKEYSEWLEKYWRQTIKNMHSKLAAGAKFTLIMVEKWGKLNLLEDMSSIVTSEGFTKADEMCYKTTRSHLTDKRTSKNSTKSTEKVVTFIKTAL